MPDPLRPVREEVLPPAIPAATVVLLRDGAEGVETLMLRRDSKLVFAGGAWVFPGGRIDPEDYPGGEVSSDADTVLTAARNAAAREAMEEAGLVVDPDSLAWFAHWTPGAMPTRRFATWFFVGAAPEGRVVVDDGEIREHVWIRPADAIARREAGEIELIPPTWVTLHKLADAPSTAAVCAEARTAIRRSISPTSRGSTAGSPRSGRATPPTTTSTPRSPARGTGS